MIKQVVHRVRHVINQKTMERKNHSTLFHITHWKAGSQWIHKILNHCASHRIAKPQYDMVQFFNEKLSRGKIYSTVYVTREEFYSVRLPRKAHYFVIIRDLRDTLISGYFSNKVSHVLIDNKSIEIRKWLNSVSVEEGMLYLIDNWLHLSANIQQSWLAEKKKILRYEDLLTADIELLTPHILPYVALSKPEFESIVINTRFEKLTQGRAPGQEDIASHERKASPGDWQNYFSEKVKHAFKSKFGELLIKTGYEANSNW